MQMRAKGLEIRRVEGERRSVRKEERRDWPMGARPEAFSMMALWGVLVGEGREGGEERRGRKGEERRG